jgi:DNA-binding transcriptional LysR family regulator
VRLDAAIRIGALADSSAIATRLGSLRRIVVASPEYLARRGRPERLEDIMAHDLVMFGGLGRWEFGASALRVTPRLTVSTAEGAIDAVVAGLGVTRVLSYQAVDALSRGLVVQVLDSYARDEIPVHLLYPGGAHPPPKLRAFIDHAVPQLRARLGKIEAALS